MPHSEPASEEAFGTIDSPSVSWPEARRRLGEADFCWLATSSPDGRPHVRPLLAVWVDGALHFVCGAATRKGQNLRRDSRCTVSTASGGLHLVVEGTAERVHDEESLGRIADAYASKYEWPVEVRDGAFFADGAPTAGPPPYEIFKVIAEKIFGFSVDGSVSAMRWSFASASGS
jgi:nitroimidazol reductase NimA-like FMN-containing flavoprotein (pyridoxamine 5'-phosphate oxidase superfamily)